MCYPTSRPLSAAHPHFFIHFTRLFRYSYRSRVGREYPYHNSMKNFTDTVPLFHPVEIVHTRDAEYYAFKAEQISSHLTPEQRAQREANGRVCNVSQVFVQVKIKKEFN